MICLISMVVDLLGKIKSILIIVIMIFLISGCYRGGPPGGNIIYNYYNVTNATGNGTVAGSDTEIQYNDNNSFGASSDLYWNDTEKLLGVDGYGMFSGTFNKSELYGTGNGGDNIRIYESTSDADHYARFRVSNESVILGENVPGRALDLDITGGIIMYSPNGTEFYCGVNNTGTFLCI